MLYCQNPGKGQMEINIIITIYRIKMLFQLKMHGLKCRLVKVLYIIVKNNLLFCNAHHHFNVKVCISFFLCKQTAQGVYNDHTYKFFLLPPTAKLS